MRDPDSLRRQVRGPDGRLPAQPPGRVDVAEGIWQGLPVAASPSTFTAHVAAGRSAHPEVDVDDARIVAQLADDSKLENAPDVVLAAACAAGCPRALATFEARYGAILDAPSRPGAIDVADLAQSVREALFTGPSPKIAHYRGKAPLEHWLRVVVLRRAESMRRKRRLDVDDGAVLEAVVGDGDPERAVRHREVGEAYRHAFTSALEALPAEDRALLKLHYVDGLGIDPISRLLGIHRATAARRLATVRERLATDTLARAARETAMTQDELASALRSVRSQLDVSIRRALEP